MVNYANAKIYRIVDNAYTKCYIGSTCKKLSQRIGCHRGNYKCWKAGKAGKIMVYDMFDQYGVSNCKIELIEAFPCNNKDELNKREGYHIQNTSCVNKYIAGRTKKESGKEYRDANKDRIKAYRDANQDSIKAYKKEYQKLNQDSIKAKFTCDCGGKYTRRHKSTHEKSKLHQTFLQTQKTT